MCSVYPTDEQQDRIRIVIVDNDIMKYLREEIVCFESIKRMITLRFCR